MGTNVSAYVVRDTLEDSDEEFLAALGFEHARLVTAWQDAHLGFIRCRGSFVLTVYGAFEGQVSQAIEAGDDPLSRVLCQCFEGFDVLAIVLQGATGLAGFSLFVDGLPVRRWCRADGPGTVVDTGARLPAEDVAASRGFDGEDTVHQVTEGVLGFDLIDVFRDRDAGLVAERRFRLTP